MRVAIFATASEAAVAVAAVDAQLGYPKCGHDEQGRPVNPDTPGAFGWTMTACAQIAHPSDGRVAVFVNDEDGAALAAHFSGTVQDATDVPIEFIPAI